MKVINYTLAVILLFSGCLFSCSDDGEDDKPEAVAVKSVEIVSCIDLTQRKDWNLRFGYGWRDGIFYNFKIDGKNISADSPKKDLYHFDEEYKEGQKLGPSNNTYIRFVPDGYFPMDNSELRSTPPTPPAIQDQSTLEKLIKADALFCSYEGIVTGDLKDVKFIHENVLLEFETIDIPENAEIRLMGSSGRFDITPYKVSEGNYKVIILSKIPGGTNYIAIKIGEDSYNLEFNYNRESDIHHIFKLRLDNEKLVIENMKSSIWSEDGDVLTEN